METVIFTKNLIVKSNVSTLVKSNNKGNTSSYYRCCKPICYWAKYSNYPNVCYQNNFINLRYMYDLENRMTKTFRGKKSKDFADKLQLLSQHILNIHDSS